MTPPDEEIEETPVEKPKRRRSRKGSATEAASASEATRSDEPEAEVDDETARVASEADAPPSAGVDEEDAVPAEEVEQEPVAVAEDDLDDDDDDADEDDDAPVSADDAQEPEAAAKRRRLRRRGAAAEESADVTPAPAPTRRRERPVGPPPVVRAQAKYVRSSPRKARLVCDHIRGKSVEEARAILAHTPRAVAKDWSKLLESAVANAEHNHELVGEDLYVKAVSADDGPTIKRFRPRAMGRATKIRKRTSHLTILLTPKD
jgi:ribosomal protein L22